jgi:hypothetical protein
MTDGERAALALKGAEGKRLTYRQPREATHAYLWALGTASFARPLPRKRCGPPRPRQSDFGCIDIPTVKDALGSLQWRTTE